MAALYSLACTGLAADAKVVGILGEEGLSRLYRFDVWVQVLEDEMRTLDLAPAIGSSATLAYHQASGTVVRTVHGIVAEAECVDASLVRVRIVPRVWRQTLDRQSRVFVGKTFRDIFDELLRAGGLSDDDFELNLNNRYAGYDHVCQYRESAWTFLSRWMEALGVLYWFEHDGTHEKLVVADVGERQILAERHRSLPADPVQFTSTGEDDDRVVPGLWRVAHQRAVTAHDVTVTDYDFMTPSVALTATQASALPGEGRQVRYYEDSSTNAGEVGRVAKRRSEELSSAAERYHGVGRVLDFLPGAKFELIDHPRLSLNQHYLTVAVKHRGNALPRDVGDDALRARLGSKLYGSEVEMATVQRTYRTPRVTPVPVARNLEVGVVDGEQDNEYAQLDDAGRYLVKLHFDGRDNPAGGASTRVRMMQPHAGAPEGWHFPLRKGTEVLIGFVDGDPDRPFIAAATPDGTHPSVVTRDNHTQNVLNTGGNNRFEIEDLDGSQYIDISTPPQHTFVHLGKHHGSHQHNAIASTAGDGLVHQGSNQDILVGGDKTEEVTKDVSETYENTQTVTVGNDVTEVYHATQTTNVTELCQEDYGTQTTEVTGDKTESCASQYTHVKGHLQEHHGAQNTTVNALLDTSCTERNMTVSNLSAQLHATLTINVGSGGWTVTDDSAFFIDAPNYTVLVPTMKEVTNQIVEMAPSNATTIKGSKTSQDNIKLSIMVGILTMFGLKTDANGIAIGLSSRKASMLGFKSDLSGVKIEKKPTATKIKTGFKGAFAALRAWL